MITEKLTNEIEGLWSNSDRMGGTWCFIGTRIPIDSVIYLMARGESVKEICTEWYETLTPPVIYAGLKAIPQLLTLIDSREQPKDVSQSDNVATPEDVKEALEWLDWREQDRADRLEACYSKDGILAGEGIVFKTIRKALIHYGNMPKKAYRHNEKLTREETT